ncbi:hypothetical protein MPSEU_000798100 [Mayamaea pseudoterrestris]|nr:hypothetical protein MPSEU_000798100 [Mayamaea pseudoterrestris]
MKPSMHGLEEHEKSRFERKQEGKRLKREKIETSGGKRPRTNPPNSTSRKGPTNNYQKPLLQRRRKQDEKVHRFGRVMDQTPCPGKPRKSTLSIAVPGSIVSNAQTRELKTYLVSQIARAATIYHVDEVVVYDDKLSVDKQSSFSRQYQRNRARDPAGVAMVKDVPSADNQERTKVLATPPSSNDPHVFMARVLQYCECPQYLRRNFFPMHSDLQFAGLLPPIDAPHHVRAEDRTKYREGVVLDKCAQNGNSLVNCGIRNRPVEIDTRLKPGIRCTVQLDPASYSSTGPIRGAVVSPATPRLEDGTYWGYSTRLASSIQKVLDECPFSSGYDLKIGTSERGTQTLECKAYSIPSYEHAIIVFGGVAGIEECVDADESIMLPGSKSHTMFDQWVNICPYQGSRTIRTEEAVMITLSKLGPMLSSRASSDAFETHQERTNSCRSVVMKMSDDEVSDESSCDNSC